MTQTIGYNNNIRVGSRKLHVQTHFDEGSKRAQSSIFDGGQLIDAREHFIDEMETPELLEAEVRQFHDLVIADLELLFHVINKVRTTKNPAAIIKLGSLFLEKGFIDEAIETFKAVIKSDAHDQTVYLHLGRAYYKKGDYEAAQEHLGQALEQEPKYPDVHVLSAEVHRKMQNPLKAMEALQSAITINPDYLRAHLLMGLILAESTLSLPTHADLAPPIERIKESKKHLQYALTLVNEVQRGHLEAGLELMDSREGFEEGLAEIEKAIDTVAGDHRSMVADSEFYLKFMFADFEHNSRTLDNYIKILERTITKHPDYADVRQSLGTAYLLRGWHNFAKALEAYREAVKINPQYQKAKKNMRLLENEGRGFLILLRSILK